MKLSKLIMPFIVAMLALCFYSQSASAFEKVAEPVLYELQAMPSVDKSAFTLVTVNFERQTPQANNQKNTNYIENEKLVMVTSDYPAGFKSRPGW